MNKQRGGEGNNIKQLAISKIKTNEVSQVFPPLFCAVLDSEIKLTHFAAFIALPLQAKNAFPVRVL